LILSSFHKAALRASRVAPLDDHTIGAARRMRRSASCRVFND